tara:strand:- start:176 stop:289 length:114 start_codon:yes stop_codon:yes gene_type:complete
VYDPYKRDWQLPERVGALDMRQTVAVGIIKKVTPVSK